MTDGKNKAPLQIGDEMEDGTIYAGSYKGKPLYTTPEDAPGIYDFNHAAKYAKNLDAHGHNDFRVPTEGELDVLYENRNKGKLKGTFNETGSDPDELYWSSTTCWLSYPSVWVQRFEYGNCYVQTRREKSSLRLVRS